MTTNDQKSISSTLEKIGKVQDKQVKILESQGKVIKVLNHNSTQIANSVDKIQLAIDNIAKTLALSEENNRQLLSQNSNLVSVISKAIIVVFVAFIILGTLLFGIDFVKLILKVFGINV